MVYLVLAKVRFKTRRKWMSSSTQRCKCYL